MVYLVLLFIALTNAYDVNIFNEFTADVDIYDMGTMGRGKNAASWHRSPKDQQEIFYYLAMQPWRHLEWKKCIEGECYKYYINEDASNLPKEDGSTKLKIESANDYCRREYSHPLGTFDVDWTLITPETRLDSMDINGVTCYKYPAKAPLAWIYLQQHYTEAKVVNSVTPCRYDFIGGKSITFRSFSKFSAEFITAQQPTGYLVNLTRCNIDPSPNNVKTDLAIVLGISDANARQGINQAISKLADLTTVQKITLYYMKGESMVKESSDLKDINKLKNIQISAGAVDAVINVAKNDLVERVNSKAIYRGTMVVLMDRALATTFDAETAFDRNNITVHTVIFNPTGDVVISRRAASLLSVGYQQYEFKAADEATATANKLFLGIRANLTERCNRTSCNGFCDGRDRCTCPMCCENTCFFSYCKAKTATCMPWPEANPKPKITCKNDCVGNQECIDLEGCVYTSYKGDCKPKAKCLKPYCEEKTQQCKVKDACTNDTRPSYENKCWSYKCDEDTGNCVRLKSGNECPKLANLCMEHVCDDNQVCTAVKKDCVKTSLFAEMKCYKAACNPKTGMCENQLNCKDNLGSYVSCVEGESETLCECNAASGFECKCKSLTPNYCSATQICDTTDEVNGPKCDTSKCGQDLYIDGCEVKTCDETKGTIVWKPYDCKSKVTVTYETSEVKGANTKTLCENKYEIVCDDSDSSKAKCQLRMKDGEDEFVQCGKCVVTEVSSDPKTHKSKYSIQYVEACSTKRPVCMDGSESKNYDKYFGETGNAVCKNIAAAGQPEEYKCVYHPPTDVFDYCSGCFDMECNAAKGYKDYAFDEKTGVCSYRQVGLKPQCSYCNDNNDGYTMTCIDKKFTKQYTVTDDYEGTKVFDYSIPKECVNNQCIPVQNFKCVDESNPEVTAIVTELKKCAKKEEVNGEYIISDLYNSQLRQDGKPQSDEFMATAEEKYYCKWTFEPIGDCYSCRFKGEEESKSLDKVDDCKAIHDTYEEPYYSAITVECNAKEECEVKFVDQKCKPKECYLYNQVQDKCVKDEASYTCNAVKTELDAIKAKYDPAAHPMEKEIVCNHKPVCQDDDFTCKPVMDSEQCKAAYERYLAGTEDFGCRIPNVDCDFDTLHCTYTKMTKPEEDTRYFTNRDNVVFGDLCYNYTCVEEVVDGKLEHHWKLTAKSVEEQNKQPESVCETASCNPLTGRSESKVKDCLVSEHFKQISEAQAECFYCQCSYLNGEMVLVMMPETEGKTYELDACGNCIVRDKKTGQQVNDPVDCVLDAPVNLTGAIAGATVAASVVFGLIGSMVVVSIGAFQTYQLVSSAMKNVISTTLENPEFVAADNEATNVLNNE